MKKKTKIVLSFSYGVWHCPVEKPGLSEKRLMNEIKKDIKLTILNEPAGKIRLPYLPVVALSVADVKVAFAEGCRFFVNTAHDGTYEAGCDGPIIVDAVWKI